MLFTISASLLFCLAGIPSILIFAASSPDDLQTTQQAEILPSTAVNIRLRSLTPGTRPIQVDVHMVVVGVTVTDHDGRVITGLNKSNFKIYDERVPQQIATFSSADVPASVGLILDSSASMADKVERSREAAFEFFKTSNIDDEFMLVAFNDRPQLLLGFTSKPEALEASLASLETRGRTALLDAIYLGLNEMRRAHTRRKALVVISDGIDNQSRYTEKEIVDALRESDTQLYAIGILGPAAFRWMPGEKSGPALLSRLAKLSGGNMFPARRASELPGIAQKLSLELRSQYEIGYKPSNLVRDGRWRQIKLEVDPPETLPGLQVYSRAGYYAPTQ